MDVEHLKLMVSPATFIGQEKCNERAEAAQAVRKRLNVQEVTSGTMATMMGLDLNSACVVQAGTERPLDQK